MFPEFAKEYNEQFKPVEELREAIKATVSAYDVKVAKERDEAKRKRNQPDEEGWVTVTREDKHSFRPVSQKGKVTASDEPPRKKPKSSVPFYSHEAKESKLNHLRDLQQKFEEDKKRLIMARAARKFNPL
ncbi:rRNA processing protein RRP7 [Aphelenchoides avenae]|nr:rRNA processing protein RRP7 [Aphelenchus avenae]